MNETTGATDPASKHTRTPSREFDFELWKHYSSIGGQDKNTMVTIDSWLLGGSAVMLTDIRNDRIDQPGVGHLTDKE